MSKPKFFKVCFLIIILFFMYLSNQIIWSQNISNEKKNQDSKESPESILRAQLELMRYYDQKILNTVYWSLGGLITVGVLLIGFGWFANVRMYERDKMAFRQEILAFIKEEISKFQININNEIKNSFANLKIKSKELVEASILNLKNDIMDIQFRVLQINANTRKYNKNYEIAVIDYIEMLKLSIKLNDSYHISDTLDDIKSVLPNIKALASIWTTQIIELLEKLPLQYSVVIREIKSLLSNNKATS